MPAKPTVIACPQCGTRVVWSPDNAFRPFCSERCKMIDLGAWATESYRVPVEEHDDPDSSLDYGDGDPAQSSTGARGSQRRN